MMRRNQATPTIEEYALERAQDAHRVAKSAERMAIVLAVIGVIGGIAIALIRTDTCNGTSSIDGTCVSTNQYPFVGAGVGATFASFFTAAMVVMVARYIQFRTAAYEAQRS